MGKDSLKVKSTIKIGQNDYSYFSIKSAAKTLKFDWKRLPVSIRILFENLLRFEDGKIVTMEDIKAVPKWLENKSLDHEILFFPARVLMQDFTGVPAIIDLAAMREAITLIGGKAEKVNPLINVDLVIDHSIQVDKYANKNAFLDNVILEMQRNKERYEFLRWGQSAFSNFRLVPPGTGICHQVNLEYIAKVIWVDESTGEKLAYPDTLVGTDSHTTMINSLAVLGWGVGGIEAEAVMLGQPLSKMLPEVVGIKLTGKMREGTTATDLVLCITELLRAKGVVGKFVEFYGEGLKNLSLADRSTISNMAPEYGATCAFFPVDTETLRYLRLTARSDELINLVEQYAKVQGLWHDESFVIEYTDQVELDLSKVEACMAGPKRPQDRVILSHVPENFTRELPLLNKDENNIDKKFQINAKNYQLANGDVVIAAITSCTNTSNPYVMIGAGIMAKRAVDKGLNVKPWVKTSLAPGSKVVSEYLEKSGLQYYLDKLGFQLVGYGCTTCIGNSGPLEPEIEQTIQDNNLVVVSVLSGNRNFEGRIHPLVRANYLASPLLCVAYALLGTIKEDITKAPIGKDKKGRNVYLKDIWPSTQEIEEHIKRVISPKIFSEKYADVFEGDEVWQKLQAVNGTSYLWDPASTYIKKPPYFDNIERNNNTITDIKQARILALLGDSITTDHISPAGSISRFSPAASYLMNNHVKAADFNSYGSRRGNHEVMMRGTFANNRIKNEMVPGVEGGYTVYNGQSEPISIYDAAMKYAADTTPLVIFAGKEYGTGSSRDWAAKGTKLLGIKAVIAESFERIHRSNLVGMGVIPLTFKEGESWRKLNLKGNEVVDIIGLDGIYPQKELKCIISQNDNKVFEIDLTCRVDTEVEIEYVKNGGILQYMLRKLVD